MNASVAYSLGLLLLCVLHAWAVGDTLGEKKGSCPQPPSYPKCEDLYAKPAKGCSTDQKCPGEEKCCYYGCRMQCKKPLKEKLGFCKDFDRAICLRVRPLPDECESDDQCPGTTRCCCSNCSRACSETVKSGICPLWKEKCMVPLPKPKCKYDSDCPGRQKCCSQCGDHCMDPEPVAENPGVCPVDRQIEAQCGFLPPPLCSRDAECAPNQKCCRFGCRVQCVKALPEKAGVCPNILAKCKVPLDPPQCQSDRDCLSSKKCCKSCGNKCLNPEPVHDGSCPVIYTLVPWLCDGVYTNECNHDSVCQDGEKCCEVGCKMTCVTTRKEKSGKCPFIPIDESAEDMCNKCNDDKDCPGKEKCCAGAKGHECRDPQPDKVIEEPEQCQKDGDCPRNERCCYFECGKKCKATETEKPGECPEPLGMCNTFVPREGEPKCTKDKDCPGAQKCCTHSCITECMDVIVEEKPGVCPPTTTLCKPGYPAPKPKCTKDKDCPGAQKCCIPLCDSECTDVIVKVKPGKCPPMNLMCTKPPPRSTCKVDSDCLGNLKCCNRCGMQCVPPN